MDPLALMPSLRRRRPRRQASPRRSRTVGHAAPRPTSWWLALGTLLLLLALPLLASAQGLRSTSMSVSLSATRHPDAPPVARDLWWDVGPVAADARLSLHLVEGPMSPALHVRDAAGRLSALLVGGVSVRGSALNFRVVRKPGDGGAPGHWRMLLRIQRAGGVEERPFILREDQSVRP